MFYDYLLSLLCVAFFCLCLQQAGRHMFQPARVSLRQRFSKKALRIEKAYHVAAWALLAMVCFYTLLRSFFLAFSQV